MSINFWYPNIQINQNFNLYFSLEFVTWYIYSITHSWALLYRDIFTPVHFIIKVSEHADTSKYAIKVSERHQHVFCIILQYRYIRHEILFQAQCNATVIICRKQMDSASLHDIRFRHFHRKYRHVPILLPKLPAHKYCDTWVPNCGITLDNP